MSQRTGIGTNALSELGYAAGQSGSSLEDLENGLRKMQKTIGDAQNGSKEASTALQRLGITQDMLAEPPDAQLELFAEKINAIEDPAALATAVMKIFGKSGTNLLPLFSGGAAGIRQLREEAVKLGVSIGPEDAEAATNLGDAWDRVKTLVGAAMFNVGV